MFGTWLAIVLIGTIPFLLSGISFTDSFFESAAGFTTTGCTVLEDIESLSAPLQMYRAITHWIGGMGIVLLTAALFPLLGIGAFQLIKAETTGPEKEKITPKVAETAKILWLIYLALTAALLLLYKIGGMNWFDAIFHGLSIMSGGGISDKEDGLSFFQSDFIINTTTVFMFLTSINFALYFKLVTGRIKDIGKNSEFKVFICILLVSTVIVTLSIVPNSANIGDAISKGLFHTASFLSTTGVAVSNYEAWPAIAQGVLLFLMLIGGCSGSTAGGIKIVRITTLAKQAINEIKRIVYPRGFFNVRLNGKPGRKDIIYGTASFCFVYMFILMLLTIATSTTGFDPISSFSASIAVLGNTGLGFGAAGINSLLSDFHAPLKWLYALAMIVGRLELWTFLVLFRREYWE